MIVYIVMGYEPYDSAWIEAVFMRKKDADKYLKEECKSSGSNYYEVDKWKVR